MASINRWIFRVKRIPIRGFESPSIEKVYIYTMYTWVPLSKQTPWQQKLTSFCRAVKDDRATTVFGVSANTSGLSGKLLLCSVPPEMTRERSAVNVATEADPANQSWYNIYVYILLSTLRSVESNEDINFSALLVKIQQMLCSNSTIASLLVLTGNKRRSGVCEPHHTFKTRRIKRIGSPKWNSSI